MYACLIASVAVAVLVAAYFAVLRHKKGKVAERGSSWPYQIVGSGDGIGPHLVDSDDEEDDMSEDEVFIQDDPTGK